MDFRLHLVVVTRVIRRKRFMLVVMERAQRLVPVQISGLKDVMSGGSVIATGVRRMSRQLL